MGMDDNKLKSLLQEGMEYEADCIMAEVDRNPDMKDVIAPEEIHDKLMKQIREHEEAQETEEKHLSKEERELIRLGKIYKKKRGRRKYTVLIAAAVCALGVGTISFGDGKKVITEVKRILSGREQTVVNTDDGGGDKFKARDVLSEEEAYEQINEEFGFYPVKLIYLPDGMEFSESVTDASMQGARLYYDDLSGKRIIYYIVTDYLTGSVGLDIEDTLIQEYEKEVDDRKINIREYLVEDNGTRRYLVSFEEKEIRYWMLLIEIDIHEVEKIVENLIFS